MSIACNFTANPRFFEELIQTATPANFDQASQPRMKLTPDDLKRIAHLARIAVSEADVVLMQTQLEGIFGLIDELQAVDTQGAEPLSHPLDIVQDMAQRLREDRITEADNFEANMANAPAQENGLFLVPKVLE